MPLPTLRGARVLVDVREPSDTTVSGIYLPENAREKEYRAIVVALGPGTQIQDGSFIPIHGLEVGDEVFISAYGAVKIEVDDKAYLMYDQSDILGVYPKES